MQHQGHRRRRRRRRRRPGRAGSPFTAAAVTADLQQILKSPKRLPQAPPTVSLASFSVRSPLLAAAPTSLPTRAPAVLPCSPSLKLMGNPKQALYGCSTCSQATGRHCHRHHRHHRHRHRHRHHHRHLHLPHLLPSSRRAARRRAQDLRGRGGGMRCCSSRARRPGGRVGPWHDGADRRRRAAGAAARSSRSS